MDVHPIADGCLRSPVCLEHFCYDLSMEKISDEREREAESVALPAPRQWVPKAQYMQLFEMEPDPAFFDDIRELGGIVECPLGDLPAGTDFGEIL